MELKGKSVFITGGSRGIGREIACRLAAEGAHIAIAAKTDEAHPNLEGTIYTVAKEIEALGGKALPLKVDVRDADALAKAINQAADTFSGLDILINNASAIALTTTVKTEMKRFDLMMAVNMRATFAAAQAAIPHLLKSENPHILTLSPPLNMDPKWFKDHLAYTMSKYGMSHCTLGLAAEFREAGIAVNSLWPKTTIATAAISVNFPSAIYQASRKPLIVAEAALAILKRPSRTCTGQFFIDEAVLREEGIDDFSPYAITPDKPLFTDLFLESEHG